MLDYDGPRYIRGVPTDKKKCTFMWADWDSCGRPENHEGNHDVFGPKCGVTSPDGEFTCNRDWYFCNGSHHGEKSLQWKEGDSV